MIRSGDILVYRKSGGIIPSVLTWLIRRCDSEYNQWCKDNKFEIWHMEPVMHVSPDVVVTMCAGAGGSHLVSLDNDYLKENCKAFRWFDKKPDADMIGSFIFLFSDKPYDTGSYFGTALALLWEKITGKSWRIVDEEYHCQELTAAFCRFMNKPILPNNVYPLMTKMIKQLKDREVKI